jgi:uncharacterized protein YciI
MKHFLVEVTYRIPADELGDILTEHRKFLQIGYGKGWLLLSGPLETRKGGLVIARAPSLADLEEFFKDDPYQLKGVADHRFIEFNPVLCQDFMISWIAGQ